MSSSDPSAANTLIVNDSQATLSHPSTQTGTTALAVILYGYDEWWLALPKSEADAIADVRNCNWLYVVHTLSGGGDDDASQPITYAVREKVKVVTSSCFIRDVSLEKGTAKNTYTLSLAEKERIDTAFAVRLAAEAREQEAEVRRLAEAERVAQLAREANAAAKDTVDAEVAVVAEASIVAGVAKKKGKRSRDEGIEIVDSQQGPLVATGRERKEKIKKEKAPVVPSVPVAPIVSPPPPSAEGSSGPPRPLVCAGILSVPARDAIFGIADSSRENRNDGRLHMLYWDGISGTCRLLERVAAGGGVSATADAPSHALFHAYGPPIGVGEVRFIPADSHVDVAAVPCVPLDAFELRVEDARGLERARQEDYARRQALANMPPPPRPTLVSAGGDHWGFSGAIVPLPCLPDRPKGMLPTTGGAQFHHFIHNGIVHSVPIAAWNRKVSEIAASRFCRDTAREAELSARNFFLMLQQLRRS